MTVAVYNSIDRIVRMAMFDAGLLEEGSDPTADQMGNYSQRLLDMMQMWQVEGCKLHLLQDTILPLTLNQHIYTLGPTGSVTMVKPLRVEDMYFQAPGGARRNIFQVTRQEWDRLPGAQNNGVVTQFLEERLPTFLRLSLWNKPGAQDIAGELHVVLRISGPGSISGSSDPITNFFPIEWAMALRWGLAMDLCTGQPDAIVQRCTQSAQTYKMILEGYDVEGDGISFQPDTDAGIGFRSRFS